MLGQQTNKIIRLSWRLSIGTLRAVDRINVTHIRSHFKKNAYGADQALKGQVAISKTRSLTFVPVYPGFSKSPSASKKGYASFRDK